MPIIDTDHSSPTLRRLLSRSVHEAGAWHLAVWMILAVSYGCAGRAPASVGATPTPPGPVVSATDETADSAMRLALASALQGRGNEAVATLQSIAPDKLPERYAPTRGCMLQRLGARTVPAINLSDPFLARVLPAYREYWLRSLRAEHPLADNEAWLLAALNHLVKSEGGTPAATMDELEPRLAALIVSHGYHPLLGLTRPLRELMLWRTETEARYDVTLPETTEEVTVVFMDDFASLGWAGFATCDRHHSGGWTKPDRLYAVRGAYDLASERFRVSYLAHEAQHFSDNRRFPALAQPELEFRAKLVELAVARISAYDLLDAFAGNVGDDVAVPHSYANARVVREMGRRLLPAAPKTPAWREVSIERINRAAAEMLREDTARLERAGAVPGR
jgi:hypothetical protein